MLPAWFLESDAGRRWLAQQLAVSSDDKQPPPFAGRHGTTTTNAADLALTP